MKVDASNGMTYAPKGKPAPVVKPGEFIFSAAHLDHGHIYGMTNALIEAGGTLKYVYDKDPAKVAKFLQTYPQAKAADSLEQLLERTPNIRLVVQTPSVLMHETLLSMGHISLPTFRAMGEIRFRSRRPLTVQYSLFFAAHSPSEMQVSSLRI